MDVDRLGDLLEIVKNYLQVPWSDEATDRRYTYMIEGAEAWLDEKLGPGSDYLAPGNARTLLLERCRYERDGALDVFPENYRSLIIAEQNRRRIDAYAAQAALQADA